MLVTNTMSHNGELWWQVTFNYLQEYLEESGCFDLAHKDRDYLYNNRMIRDHFVFM